MFIWFFFLSNRARHAKCFHDRVILIIFLSRFCFLRLFRFIVDFVRLASTENQFQFNPNNQCKCCERSERIKSSSSFPFHFKLRNIQYRNSINTKSNRLCFAHSLVWFLSYFDRWWSYFMNTMPMTANRIQAENSVFVVAFVYKSEKFMLYIACSRSEWKKGHHH